MVPGDPSTTIQPAVAFVAISHGSDPLFFQQS
jgi:hypothetical protein